MQRGQGKLWPDAKRFFVLTSKARTGPGTWRESTIELVTVQVVSSKQPRMVKFLAASSLVRGSLHAWRCPGGGPVVVVTRPSAQ